MKRLAGSVLILLLAGVGSPVLGESGSAPKGQGKQNVVIRGEKVGFVAVSPALERAVEAKAGRKSPASPRAMGPNAEVRKDGFTYVSPAARGKK